jgi:flagellar basal body-associated protein FliL
MRGLVIFLVVAGMGGGLFFLQKRSEQKQTTAQASAQAAPSPRQTYEHDWAKHSLDTTHSVIQKIQQQRKDDDLKDAVGRR